MDNIKYIGDGVYAGWDGYHIVLMTGNPVAPDDTIYLDDQVRMALMEYIVDLFKKEANDG